MTDLSNTGGRAPEGAGRITRHRLSDRLFHWLMAASVLTLLLTAFLPIVGIQFGWVTIHWVAGIVLTVLILFHIVRAIGWLRLGTMMIWPSDVADTWRIFKKAIGKGQPGPVRTAKYSVAQKLVHLAVTVIILAVTVTGLMMLPMVIDIPLVMERNANYLPAAIKGWVYLIHGYAAMLTITVIAIHIYFGLRPEKLFFTRSMIRGWITRDEYGRVFDPKRWNVDAKSSAPAGASPQARQAAE